jgi:zinc transporter ZupT
MAGAIVFFVVEKLVSFCPFLSAEDESSILPTAPLTSQPESEIFLSLEKEGEQSRHDKAKKLRLGMLMMVTLTLHNFPEVNLKQ